jgi:hypothetical protein
MILSTRFYLNIYNYNDFFLLMAWDKIIFGFNMRRRIFDKFSKMPPLCAPEHNGSFVAKLQPHIISRSLCDLFVGFNSRFILKLQPHIISMSLCDSVAMDGVNQSAGCNLISSACRYATGLRPISRQLVKLRYLKLTPFQN